MMSCCVLCGRSALLIEVLVIKIYVSFVLILVVVYVCKWHSSFQIATAVVVVFLCVLFLMVSVTSV